MKKHLGIGLGILVLFLVFTVLVKTVDVQPIGRQGTDVGFASINEGFNKFFGENETVYKITEAVGYIGLCAAGIFAVIGLLQLIKRKSLKKVDADILLLGGLYAVLLLCYILFEKIVINYRPVYGTEDALEASFPSTHTLMLLGIMASTVMQVLYRVKKKGMRAFCSSLCSAIALVVIIGRAVCGVHWFTDIIGGLLLAVSLSWIYYAVAFAAKKEE
ncbi:MAG: phosphatase PAP2 family protein [Lachnospiraceae bacterium]|nr:phosphatase PAP2 family protein [Lachnospiraceae bacterium]